MIEIDPNGVEAAATAIVGAEVGYEMKLSRLVDGVSTYTLKLETGEQFEFGNTDDVYEKIASEKAKRQAEAAITAYLSTVSPLSDGDGWQGIATAPRDGTHIIVAGGVAYWRDGAWWTITGVEMPGTPIEWPVALWRPLGHPSIAENDAAIRALADHAAPPREEVAHE